MHAASNNDGSSNAAFPAMPPQSPAHAPAVRSDRLSACENEQAWLDAGAMRKEQPAASLFDPNRLPADGPRRFTIDWVDREREAAYPADPNYPEGVAIDVALDAPRACRVELPCPAARCGMWVVICKQCGFAIALGTAGLADDPRSVRVPCKPR